MISSKGGIRKEDTRKSATQGTSTGSGSRPGGKSRHPMDSSAPVDSKNLGGRGNVPGKLT